MASISEEEGDGVRGKRRPRALRPALLLLQAALMTGLTAGPALRALRTRARGEAGAHGRWACHSPPPAGCLLGTHTESPHGRRGSRIPDTELVRGDRRVPGGGSRRRPPSTRPLGRGRDGGGGGWGRGQSPGEGARAQPPLGFPFKNVFISKLAINSYWDLWLPAWLAGLCAPAPRAPALPAGVPDTSKGSATEDAGNRAATGVGRALGCAMSKAAGSESRLSGGRRPPSRQGAGARRCPGEGRPRPAQDPQGLLLVPGADSTQGAMTGAAPTGPAGGTGRPGGKPTHEDRLGPARRSVPAGPASPQLPAGQPRAGSERPIPTEPKAGDTSGPERGPQQGGSQRARGSEDHLPRRAETGGQAALPPRALCTAPRAAPQSPG